MVQSACQYDVTSRVSDFQNGEQAFPFGFGAKKRPCKGIFGLDCEVFIGETDKNFDFTTEILFRFLGFGDFKIPIVIKNKT